MRREGRPHGVVQTQVIPTVDNNRAVKNLLKSPATAGVFTRVPSRPTNHSKFTGRCCKSMCLVCHLQPAGKAKHKSKGSKKFGVGADLDDIVVHGNASRFADDGDGDYDDDDDDDDGSSSSSDGSECEGWVVLENINYQVLTESD